MFLSGTLTVSPSNGTALETEFTFRALLFTDKADYPLNYKFGFYATEDGKEVKIYSGVKSAQNTRSTQLAQGLFHRQSRSLIIMQIGQILIKYDEILYLGKYTFLVYNS